MLYIDIFVIVIIVVVVVILIVDIIFVVIVVIVIVVGIFRLRPRHTPTILLSSSADVQDYRAYGRHVVMFLTMRS